MFYHFALVPQYLLIRCYNALFQEILQCWPELRISERILQMDVEVYAFPSGCWEETGKNFLTHSLYNFFSYMVLARETWFNILRPAHRKVVVYNILKNFENWIDGTMG